MSYYLTEVYNKKLLSFSENVSDNSIPVYVRDAINFLNNAISV